MQQLQQALDDDNGNEYIITGDGDDDNDSNFNCLINTITHANVARIV